MSVSQVPYVISKDRSWSITITRVINQCPERYRGENFHIDFLRRAIQSEPWAADPIARAGGDEHSFTQFYNNVATRLTLATLLNNSAHLSSPSAGQLPIPSFYGERVTYTPSHKRTNGDRSNYSTHTLQHHSSYSKPRACFNYGSLEHLLARCPKPRSAVKSGRERLLTTPATELLFEALDQFDQEPSRELDLAENTLFVDRRDEIEIFGTLLARSLAHRHAPTTPSTLTQKPLIFPVDPPELRHPEGI
jgi:hypothetical protein